MELVDTVAHMLGMYELAPGGDVLVSRKLGGFVARAFVRVSAPKGDELLDRVKAAAEPLSGCFSFSAVPVRRGHAHAMKRKREHIERLISDEKLAYHKDKAKVMALERELRYYGDLEHDAPGEHGFASGFVIVSCEAAARDSCVQRSRECAKKLRARLSKRGFLSADVVSGEGLMEAKSHLQRAKRIK